MRVTATRVKPNRLNSRVGSYFITPCGLRKSFSKPEQHSPVARTLHVFPDRNPSKPRDRSFHVYSDHTDNDILVDEDERMMTSFEIVRMVIVVGFKLAAILKQNRAPNSVESVPLFEGHRWSQFMFDH